MTRRPSAPSAVLSHPRFLPGGVGGDATLPVPTPHSTCLRRKRSGVAGIWACLGLAVMGVGHELLFLARRSPELLIRRGKVQGAGPPAKPASHSLLRRQSPPATPGLQPLPPPHYTLLSQPSWAHWVFPLLPTGPQTALHLVLGSPRSWSSLLNHVTAPRFLGTKSRMFTVARRVPRGRFLTPSCHIPNLQWAPTARAVDRIPRSRPGQRGARPAGPPCLPPSFRAHTRCSVKDREPLAQNGSVGY